MNKTIIGIDPGASGGIAYQIAGHTADMIGMPETDADLVLFFKTLIQCGADPANTFLFLEDLVKFAGVGIPGATMAVYAANWGKIIGASVALGFTYQLVTPRKWQNGLNLGNIGKERLPSAPKGSTPREKQLFQIENAALIAEVKRRNGNAKTVWKNKLKDTAKSLYPSLASKMSLGTADAVLILEYGKRVTSETMI